MERLSCEGPEPDRRPGMNEESEALVDPMATPDSARAFCLLTQKAQHDQRSYLGLRARV